MLIDRRFQFRTNNRRVIRSNNYLFPLKFTIDPCFWELQCWYQRFFFRYLATFNKICFNYKIAHKIELQLFLCLIIIATWNRIYYDIINSIFKSHRTTMEMAFVIVKSTVRWLLIFNFFNFCIRNYINIRTIKFYNILSWKNLSNWIEVCNSFF